MKDTVALTNGQFVDKSFNPVFDHVVDGVMLLWRSYQYALDANADVWDFAVEISELRQLGVSISDIRWLVAKGYADHKDETSAFGDEHRSFESSRGLTFRSTSALVLTRKGGKFAQTTGPLPTLVRRIEAPFGQNDEPTSNQPTWDARSRKLVVSGQIVKNFRVRADNQEAILTAFEEEGWPELIDDPLPGAGGIAPKQRLHNTINRLNQNQLKPLIRFYGNGTGEGIGWRYTTQNAPDLVRSENRVASDVKISTASTLVLN